MLKSKSRNGILHVKDDGLRVGWLERYHIILRIVIMSYLILQWMVALDDLFGKVNVIGLWTRYEIPFYVPLMSITLWEQWLEPSEYIMGSSSTWERD